MVFSFFLDNLTLSLAHVSVSKRATLIAWLGIISFGEDNDELDRRGGRTNLPRRHQLQKESGRRFGRLNSGPEGDHTKPSALASLLVSLVVLPVSRSLQVSVQGRGGEEQGVCSGTSRSLLPCKYG